jgi:hypothetical protein
MGPGQRRTETGRLKRIRSGRLGLVAVAAAVVAAVATLAAALPGGGGRPSVPAIRASAAPAGWHSVALPDGAVLSYPPSMRPVHSDPGSASSAQLSPAGTYLLYLNATPRQGAENLRDWSAFRIGHLREDNARSARELASASGVPFLGGTGSCVLDTYVTKVGAHHYTELACLVQGRHAASVIVAAAPAANWARSAGVLTRAVAAYRVR